MSLIRRLLLIAAFAALALVLGLIASSVLAQFLWFRNVGYETVFWGLLLTRAGLFVGTFVVVTVYLLLILRTGARTGEVGRIVSDLTDGGFVGATRLAQLALLLGIALVLAFVFALVIS